MSTAFLAIVSGNGSGWRVPIPLEGLIIGRDADAFGYLGSDASLSRRHARFSKSASGRVQVEDLGSTNGTYVNDARVTHPVVLRNHDMIRLGDTILEFLGDAESESRDEGQYAAHAAGGVASGGAIHAHHGSIGAIGEVGGNVDLSRRYDYDASGLGLITRARGAARFMLILGTLIAFVGFGLFGYPIVNGIVTGFSDSSAAEAASDKCDNLHPERGTEWNECQFEANRLASGDFPSLTPWLPLGAALLFGGMVISAIGLFMIRHEH